MSELWNKVFLVCFGCNQSLSKNIHYPDYNVNKGTKIVFRLHFKLIRPQHIMAPTIEIVLHSNMFLPKVHWRLLDVIVIKRQKNQGFVPIKVFNTYKSMLCVCLCVCMCVCVCACVCLDVKIDKRLLISLLRHQMAKYFEWETNKRKSNLKKFKISMNTKWRWECNSAEDLSICRFSN